MKILSVVPSYWPSFQYGGPVTSVHTLNKELAKKGVDVTVYSTNVGLNGKVPVNHEIEIDGVKVTYFNFTKLFEMLGNTGWQFSWSMTKNLQESLKTFDLIHINAIWNYPTAAAAYYCRKFKKPYIITPRGTLYPYTAAHNAWKKKPYYFLIAEKDLMRASGIHYTTEDEYDKCHASLGLQNKPTVIPNGIDMYEFSDIPHREQLKKRYPVLEGKKVILFLGRISWKKGLDILVDAFAELIRNRKNIHLVIAGPDENRYENKVKEWLMHEDILKNTTFTGMLTGKEKLEAFAGSDLFVLPSYSENFGITVLEAMACNLPVVISNKAGIYKEIENSNAGIVVETNPKSIFDGINTILDNKMLKKEIVLNGTNLVKNYFNINQVADQMIRVYEETINNAYRT